MMQHFHALLDMSLPPVLYISILNVYGFLIWYVQAFILSHELSPKEEMDTYLARQLKPLRPMISFGRAAKADPECKTHECVWYWWKDQKIQKSKTFCTHINCP
jgi:hypothetical protein